MQRSLALVALSVAVSIAVSLLVTAVFKLAPHDSDAGRGVRGRRRGGRLMRRVVVLAAALAAALLLIAPATLAADPAAGEGRVLVSVNGDVTLPPDQTAETIVVVDGVATIAGDVDTLVIVEGSAVLDGATAGTIWAVRSQVELGAGTIVTGEVMTLDSAVHQVGDATVQGGVTDMAGRLIAIGAFLAPAFLLFWLGAGLATLVAGLLLAGLASRQVRMAEAAIRSQPSPRSLQGSWVWSSSRSWRCC